VPKAGRKLRADAQANRLKLMDAAKLVFGRGDERASLEAVAREAGVGIATLYRNFPTREDLYEAVYSREVDDMTSLAETLRDAPDPVAAIRRWLHTLIDLVATKRGLVAGLAINAETMSSISMRMGQRLAHALDQLVARGIAESMLREDVSGMDLLSAVIGTCIVRSDPDWHEAAMRMSDIIVDGLEHPQR
tara:strand:+ start:113 stop:685 length:573 start_codon:yes stop_codon:yes gene_type:complete